MTYSELKSKFGSLDVTDEQVTIYADLLFPAMSSKEFINMVDLVIENFHRAEDSRAYEPNTVFLDETYKFAWYSTFIFCRLNSLISDTDILDHVITESVLKWLELKTMKIKAKVKGRSKYRVGEYVDGIMSELFEFVDELRYRVQQKLEKINALQERN